MQLVAPSRGTTSQGASSLVVATSLASSWELTTSVAAAEEPPSETEPPPEAEVSPKPESKPEQPTPKDDSGTPAPGTPSPENSSQNSPEQLLEQVTQHLASLQKAAVLEATRGHLGVRVTLFENAWHYHALEELQRRLIARQPYEHIVRDLRSGGEAKRKTKGKGAFRCELIHPGQDDSKRRAQPAETGERSAVHMLLYPFKSSVVVRWGNKKSAWKPWREPRGLEIGTVRIARHSTVRNSRLVPYITPLKPKHTRAVLRGSRGSFWGLLPAQGFQEKKGTVAWVLSYDEFHGLYDGRHIIDLNDSDNSFERDFKIEVVGQLPLFFPEPAPAIARFLEDIDKKRSKK